MPLGIMSNKEFESERLNSDNSYINEHTKQDIIEQNNITPRAPEQAPQNPDPIITSDILTIKSAGRHNDVNNIPQSLRKILGEEVAINGLASAKLLAESLGGISQPTLNTYARGEISPGQNSNESNELLAYVNQRKTKITKKALNKINLAMTLIDEDKLSECNALQLSQVAQSMSNVVRNMEPTRQNTDDKKDNNVQFHFYAPQIKNEQHYEVVTAKDNF